MDKSFDPTDIPEPTQEWCDDAFNEGVDGFLSNGQLYTTLSDHTQKMLYHQDAATSRWKEISPSGSGPVPETNLVVSSYRFFDYDVPFRSIPISCAKYLPVPASLYDLAGQIYKVIRVLLALSLDIHITPSSLPITDTRTADS